MCLYALQTTHLQKVFCMRGGKKHKSQRLCKAVFEMRRLPGACHALARPVGTVVIAGVIQARHSSALKNQCAKKTSRLFKGDS
jgi:hypothetical protein